MGNHAYNINGFVRGNVGPLSGAAGPGEGDVDINIVGSETHVVGNNLTLHAQTDTLLSAGNDIMITASVNMNVLTTSGIMSIKSGSDIDIRSATAMLLKSETTLTETVASNMVVTVGGTYTETISGIAGIKYNAATTFHFVDDYKRKIDDDTFIDKAGGFVDHSHPISPSRSSGTDAVAAL